MKISEALNFFEILLQNTTKKSESNTYQRFRDILSNLNGRDLDDRQIDSIERKLDTFNLSPGAANNKKFLKQRLTEFIAYLKEEFSFVTPGYYTGIGMIYGVAFGSGIGMALGTPFGGGIGIAVGLSIGTGIGMTFGMVYGAAKDAEAEKQGRVLI